MQLIRKGVSLGKEKIFFLLLFFIPGIHACGGCLLQSYMYIYAAPIFKCAKCLKY